mmetsp:Transcript_44592/g.89958  ORF Transcript_44592/g.89958 Transcript_44592/m.89958 type:complete len:99 (-) Transcript_44592:26-322(-)
MARRGLSAGHLITTSYPTKPWCSAFGQRWSANFDFIGCGGAGSRRRLGCGARQDPWRYFAGAGSKPASSACVGQRGAGSGDAAGPRPGGAAADDDFGW